MLEIRRIPASLFDANCYVVWNPQGTGGAGRPPALVVDPGAGTAAAVGELLETEGLELGAVLVTHGHADHVWDAAAVADATGSPVYIPEPDLFFMDNPAGLLGFASEGFGLPPWQKPALVRPITSLGFSPADGVSIRTIPAPGHSPGSSIFLFAPTDSDDATPLGFSGDVVFAGSVGRTDLPGGDERAMQQSLRTLANVVDPATTLLPGHGKATTWGHEKATNPFVKRAIRLG